MALWPFGKKNDADDTDKTEGMKQDESRDGALSAEHDSNTDLTDQMAQTHPGSSSFPASSSFEEEAGVDSASMNRVHDAIHGDMGPFDGDSVDIEEFDFSDFSAGILDLGSMRIPLPLESQVQVEMGEEGPRMLHIVTQHGRITPVAFAAPRKPGQWAESVESLREGMTDDDLPAHIEQGPWGPEVVGGNENGQMRVLGVDGPRWMMRLTLAAPNGHEEDLAQLGREIMARTFVYRGGDPILAGNSLPVVMPEQLVVQVQQAMEERQRQLAEEALAKEAAGATAEHSGAADDAAAALKEAEDLLRNLDAEDSSDKGSAQG